MCHAPGRNQLHKTGFYSSTQEDFWKILGNIRLSRSVKNERRGPPSQALGRHKDCLLNITKYNTVILLA